MAFFQEGEFPHIINPISGISALGSGFINRVPIGRSPRNTPEALVYYTEDPLSSHDYRSEISMELQRNQPKHLFTNPKTHYSYTFLLYLAHLIFFVSIVPGVYQFCIFFTFRYI